MSSEDIIKKIRIALCDVTEPYISSDSELKQVLEISAATYSKYRPKKNRGIINVKAGIKDYNLPHDFQTWLVGFEDYEVYDNILDLGFIPVRNFDIEYRYLADRGIDDIPVADSSLLIDYCFYYVIDGAIKETSDISALKLGKGLQIQFSNVSELNQIAGRRLKEFNDKLSISIGGWV